MTRLYRRPVPMMTAAVAMLLMVTACHMGAYDAGDSRHSYLRADFAEMHTNSNGALCRVLKTSWATRPDTLYRALLYYNKGEADATQSQAASRALSVTGVGARQVYVLRPQAGSAGVSGPDDAVGFQSCWMSASKRYVNVGLVLKSGQADQPDSKHILGLIRDSIVTDLQGHHTFFCRIYHLQNGVPAYYSTTVYASIPTSDFRTGDTLQLTIHARQGGVVVRKFTF